ncbi:MAG: hypothetical protein F6K17_28155 [Okeania sp. SIO3C4]|nr:hypothetical protein [Okeania sp. SIO3C4]
MPINLSLYPDNWDKIALSVKQAAGWTCQSCGRPCRPPGILLKDTEQWLIDNHPEWLPCLYEVVLDEVHGDIKIAKPQRFTLTTAHLDHEPSNCTIENLKALCSVCHLTLDRNDWNKSRGSRRMKLRERQGQLTLELGI